MKGIYVAANYHNKDEVNETYNILEKKGFYITYKWPNEDEMYDEGYLERMREHYGLDLTPNACRAIEDMNGVRNADALIYLPEGRFGSHAEIGGAAILGKPICVIGNIDMDRCIFYHLPLVKQFESLDECIVYLKDKLI